jgi:prepilin-type N-terminal cleavage/methylation domain-containing protein
VVLLLLWLEEKKMKINQKGFSVVEILIVIVVVGLLGVAGWFVYGHQKSTKQSSTTQAKSATSSSKETSTSVDRYAGWKTYKSSVEGFSFRYPADWELSNTLDARDTSTKESAALKASNNFTLSFDVYSPSDVAREFVCANCVFNGATKLETPNYGKSLYLVVDSNVVNNQPFQTLSISEYGKRDEQALKGWPYYTSKTNPGYVVRWSGSYSRPGEAGEELLYSTYDDFIGKPEVKTAKQILESLAY